MFEIFLVFSRQEKESYSSANVADVIRSAMSLVRTVIRRDQIAIKIDVPEGLPQIKCRSQQIQQVLMNLLTNSRDALNERYPEHDDKKIMKIIARESKRNNESWLRVTVEDYGVGVKAEIRDKMFEPFFTTKDRTRGSGLGLAISYGIVNDHHGELFVESELGQFTRFHVDLPVDDEASKRQTRA